MLIEMKSQLKYQLSKSNLVLYFSYNKLISNKEVQYIFSLFILLHILIQKKCIQPECFKHPRIGTCVK